MKIIGYSERGMINSFFYEMKNFKNSNILIKEFLSQISFPYTEKNVFQEIQEIVSVKVLIEQSFSDFGDADVILLIDDGVNKYSIFIEAKVTSTRRHGRPISLIFDQFKEGIVNRKVKSNLFIQIYNKMRMIEVFDPKGIEGLQSGVIFPDFSSKRRRVIGRNEVVLNAARLIKEYCTNAYFVILVPDTVPNLNSFFKTTLNSFEIDGIRIFNNKNLGFIAWEQVEDFCIKNEFKDTIENFEYNTGQIFRKTFK